MNWFQLLTCQELLLFFIMSDSNLRVFGFLTNNLSKEDVWKCHLRLRKKCDEPFSLFSDNLDGK